MQIGVGGVRSEDRPSPALAIRRVGAGQPSGRRIIQGQILAASLGRNPLSQSAFSSLAGAIQQRCPGVSQSRQRLHFD
jgi:hypothetical protein